MILQETCILGDEWIGGFAKQLEDALLVQDSIDGEAVVKVIRGLEPWGHIDALGEGLDGNQATGRLGEEDCTVRARAKSSQKHDVHTSNGDGLGEGDYSGSRRFKAG